MATTTNKQLVGRRKKASDERRSKEMETTDKHDESDVGETNEWEDMEKIKWKDLEVHHLIVNGWGIYENNKQTNKQG